MTRIEKAFFQQWNPKGNEIDNLTQTLLMYVQYLLFVLATIPILFTLR